MDTGTTMKGKMKQRRQWQKWPWLMRGKGSLPEEENGKTCVQQSRWKAMDNRIERERTTALTLDYNTFWYQREKVLSVVQSVGLYGFHNGRMIHFFLNIWERLGTHTMWVLEQLMLNRKKRWFQSNNAQRSYNLSLSFCFPFLFMVIFNSTQLFNTLSGSFHPLFFRFSINCSISYIF